VNVGQPVGPNSYLLLDVCFNCRLYVGGWNCVTAIATSYGLDGSGFETRWGRDFPYPFRLAPRSTQPPVPRVPAHIPALSTRSHLASKLKKNITVYLILLWAFVACYKPEFTSLHCKMLSIHFVL
jgi:hypothetical protein